MICGYESITIGPFHFRFYPDGDDPGIGILEVITKSGYKCRTTTGVQKDEWDRFKFSSGRGEKIEYGHAEKN